MKCPYCNSENTVVFYETNQPTILSACNEKLMNISKNRKCQITLCNDCLLGFNSSKLSAVELEEIYDNYCYVSTENGIGISQCNEMINVLKQFFSVDDKIMEIGCSEGYLLKVLKDCGYKNLTGIEPGPQAETAQKLGLNVIKGYFDEDTITSKYDGFFLVHVFEHFLDPFTMIRTMNNFLNDSGKIVIEVPNFNGYHHQHLFYYNIAFISRLCDDNKLKIVDYYMDNEILRVVLVKQSNDLYEPAKIDFNKIDFTDKVFKSYKEFKKKISKIKLLLNKYENSNIFWWGAGSLSVIYLNNLLNEVKNTKITIVDGDKNKENLFIPGIDIKVNYFDILQNKSVDVIVIASSYVEEIQNTMEKYNIRAKEIVVIS